MDELLNDLKELRETLEARSAVISLRCHEALQQADKSASCFEAGRNDEVTNCIEMLDELIVKYDASQKGGE